MNKRCLTCGLVGPWARDGRCDEHRLERQRRNDRTPARRHMKRKYDRAHRELRRLWAPVVAAGGCICPRCDEVIIGEFDLGHQSDGSPSRPEHPSCNRGAR